MNLKSLELNGFKSFGKKTVLEFTTPITSIVGPNGSGKSNVAESFRFVLGEQSIKSMRGKKGEDLIFNGSNDAPRSNRASVKLCFDNKKRLFNVDFDDVLIERVVYRDGVNEYLINGSKVRLKDIIELLSSAHIGSSGHHIISQGEADRILHTSPKERKEMIEDALGIKIYQYKKEESQKKLEKTDENVKQVESLRREIAPHLKFLKRQVEKIEKSKQIREELILKSKEYFALEEAHINFEKQNLYQERQAPEQELRDLQEKLKQARRVIEESQKGTDESSKILELEEKLGSSRRHKDEIVRELGRIEGEISYIVKTISTEKQNMENSGKPVPVSEIEILAEDIREEIQKAESIGTIEIFKDTLNKVGDILSAFINKSKTSNSPTLERLQIELENLRAKERSLQENFTGARSDEETLVSEYEEKRSEMEKNKDDTKEAEKEVFKVVARQNELHSILDRLTTREETLRADEDQFKMDLGDIGRISSIEAVKYETKRISAPIDRKEQHDKRSYMERLKIRLEEAGVSGADDTLKEYRETEERDVFLAKELEDLKKSSEDLMNLIKELDQKLAEEFKVGIDKINEEFQKYFSLMFGGGKAFLKIIKQEKRQRGEDEDMDLDEGKEIKYEEGIDIEISLPHKKIKGLMMLSGGERALTSIALLFAMSQVNPPPFVILDETDAALDESNSRKYGDMVESLSKSSELIVITHNRETMSRAGVLYGVTMGSDAVSKLLSISFTDAVEVAK